MSKLSEATYRIPVLPPRPSLLLAALVRQVISLGSPFASRLGRTNVPRVLFRIVSGRFREEAIHESFALPPPVHSTAIYSRTDGVAHWLACVEREAPHTDNIEVAGS